MRLIDADELKEEIKHLLILSPLDAPRPLAYGDTSLPKIIDEQPTVQAEPRETGTFTCFHCGAKNAVIWDCDYEMEDLGYPGEGIVHTLHCENCDAEIEYRIYAETAEQEED